MKTLLIVLCALVLTQAFKIDQNPIFEGQKLQAKPTGRTFSNYIGQGVTDDMLSDIVNFVNAASGFYKDDVAKNAQYIKSKLDKIYGDDEQNFFVFIQTEQNVDFSWYVWLTYEYVIAGLSDVNIVYPEWSYLIVKNFAPPQSDDYALITPGKVGPGVDSGVQAAINSAVNRYEPDGPCNCNDQSIVNIGNTLIQQYNRPWNTVCDASGVTTAIVKTVDGLWGSFKPKNCYYTLFINL